MPPPLGRTKRRGQREGGKGEGGKRRGQKEGGKEDGTKGRGQRGGGKDERTKRSETLSVCISTFWFTVPRVGDEVTGDVGNDAKISTLPFPPLQKQTNKQTTTFQ